jgi:SAM-dependent methyltransferase
MKLDKDLFGQALLDWTNGRREVEFFERADGAVFEGAGPAYYLSSYEDWPEPERRSMQFVRGPVVDVGCGAGRVALHLQSKGHDVVGMDASPRAIRAARWRGVENTWMTSISELGEEIGDFETIILFGNNFGILGDPDQCARTLRAWARATGPRARILAESINPYAGGAPAMDRAYYHRNKAQGRMPGSVRMRTRYRGKVGDWEEWLFVSRAEMQAVVSGTGWHPRVFFSGSPSEEYVAVFEKDC